MRTVNNYDEITLYYNDAIKLAWNQSIIAK